MCARLELPRGEDEPEHNVARPSDAYRIRQGRDHKVPTTCELLSASESVSVSFGEIPVRTEDRNHRDTCNVRDGSPLLPSGA